MSEGKTIYELISAFEASFEDILSILKAISNNKRLTILIALLTGEKTFNDLKTEVKLKKTALSNHLTKLISVSLILRADFNKYQITSDGELFIRGIEDIFKKSEVRKKMETEELQRREFSDTFVESFFGKT